MANQAVMTFLRRVSPITWTIITFVVLAVLPLGPIRAIARYFLVGYVPGLVIWKHLRPKAASIVDLVLWPSLLSILPFAWIALACVALGADLRIAGFVAIAIFLAIGFTRGWSSPIKEANGDRLALGLSLLLVVLLLVIAFAANSFQAVAWDASLHAAIVSRILADVVPPDSPMMAGQPANYYWLYHFYCAALMRLTGFSVYQVFAILNVHAFVLFILAGYRIAGRLTTNLFGRLSVVWMLVFGLNAFGWIIFFTSGSANPDKWYSLVAPFAMVKDYSPSLGSLIHEFLDGAPFAMTFAFDIAWLDILLGRAEGERGGALITGAVILATLFYLHPLTAVFLIGASFAALISFLVINRSRRDEFVGLLVDIAIITFATALVTAPYAWNILHAKTGTPVSVALNLAYLKSQAYTMLATVGLVAIIATPGIWLGIREKRRATMILTLVTVTMLLAAFVTHVELEAEYKLVYLLAFGLAPLVAVAWNFWNRTLITRMIFVLALVICVPTNMLTSYCFTVEPPRENRDQSRRQLLDWVREKTPADAILVEYPWWTKYRTSDAAYFYLDRFWFDIGVYGNRRQLIGYTAPMLEQWGYRDIELRQELARKLIVGEPLAPADLSYLTALHAPIIVITNLSVVGLREFDPASYLRIYEDGDLRAYRVLLPES